jgi:hypothetical protein
VPVAGDAGYKTIEGDFRIVGIENNPTDDGQDNYRFTFDDGSLSL